MERGEHNDCAVHALAAVAEVSYNVAHAALAARGRRARGRTPQNVSRLALKDLGFKLVHTKFAEAKSFHARRAPKVLPSGFKYILWMRGHMAAFVHGKSNDWTAERSHHVYRVSLVTKRRL